MRLIDADELDRAFSEARWYHDGGIHHWGDRSNWCLMGEEVERLITEAPTIDAEPVRRGKWEANVGGVYCSECADAWSDEVESMIQSFNYCPNCGAKMEV